MINTLKIPNPRVVERSSPSEYYVSQSTAYRNDNRVNIQAPQHLQTNDSSRVYSNFQHQPAQPKIISHAIQSLAQPSRTAPTNMHRTETDEKLVMAVDRVMYLIAENDWLREKTNNYKDQLKEKDLHFDTLKTDLTKLRLEMASNGFPVRPSIENMSKSYQLDKDVLDTIRLQPPTIEVKKTLLDIIKHQQQIIDDLKKNKKTKKNVEDDNRRSIDEIPRNLKDHLQVEPLPVSPLFMGSKRVKIKETLNDNKTGMSSDNKLSVSNQKSLTAKLSTSQQSVSSRPANKRTNMNPEW